MTSITKKKWKIWCNTENKYVEGWGLSSPTTCYNDDAHDVNTMFIEHITHTDDTIIRIKEESIETGGHYKVHTIQCNIPAGVTGAITTIDHSFPHPISMLNVFFNTCDDHVGDYISAHVGPDTIIGVITQDIESGLTGCISVSDTVLDHAKLGFFINLDNGVTSADIGCVTGVNNVGNYIQLNSTINETFSAGTYVKMTVKMMSDFYLETAQRYVLGGHKIGASYVPTNTVGRILYQNNSGTAKTFIFGIEFLY